MKPPDVEMSGKTTLIKYSGIQNAFDSGILGNETV